MRKENIFHDPKGSRAKWVKSLGLLFVMCSVIIAFLFVISMFIMPLLPPISGFTASKSHGKTAAPLSPAFLQNRDARIDRFQLHNARLELWKEINRVKEVKPIATETKGDKIVAAYYPVWEETALHSLRANADKITHLFPTWLKLSSKGNDIDTSDWDLNLNPHNLDVISIAAKNKIELHTTLSNADGTEFDAARVKILLSSEKIRDEFIEKCKSFLLCHGLLGINLDFENLEITEYLKIPSFLEEMKKRFLPSGLKVSMAIEALKPEVPYKQIGEICDFVVIMAYDENYMSSEAGPIASIEWFYKVINDVTPKIDPAKIVVGIGNYAYDWTFSDKPAESISYQTALLLAKNFIDENNPEKHINFDEDALNSTMNYTDDNGVEHEVWILDAVTAYNQFMIAMNEETAGVALWSMGTEDPGLWKFYDKKKITSKFDVKELSKVSFPYEIEFDGEGEVLSVQTTPQEGSRDITVDPDCGLLIDEVYHKLPFSYVIRRTGYKPKSIVLSFDDGPDEKYTEQILDILKEFKIPASFFVLGQNAEKFPDLIKRMWDEGHEIGSHSFSHPNMGAISTRRIELELNATQRVLQSVLDRSTTLFRPPYNADAEPTSAEEVKPLIESSRLGYITVGELIDPQDWELYKIEDGKKIIRSATDFVESTINQIKTTKGNIVLLHDGGGDRSETVKALKILVPEMQKRGYNFVSISSLMNVTRDSLMPAVNQNDRVLLGLDKPIFNAIFTGERILGYTFILAIVLGIARVLFVVILALIKRRKEKFAQFDADFKPPVTILIAAYNEESVIKKTIDSILKNCYPNLEIIIIDDGSSDNTIKVVEESFGSDNRVKLLKQDNSGKAVALNNGIKYASGEILINIDADTQISVDAIGYLVRHFSDANVAAVAGNIKVGNRINLYTKWQAIEYINSQNIDRQAYSLLNAITVVPGAIGAWRKADVVEAGGYIPDTLAEDMDLTWRLRQAGKKIVAENLAIGFTEAPESIKPFFKQRFRWSYGTLQVLWKHRLSLGKYGWFGWMALPTLWIFQIFSQVIAPLVDMQILYTLIVFIKAFVTQGIFSKDWQVLPQSFAMLKEVGIYYLLLFFVELIGAVIAFKFDKEKMKLLWFFFLQRFVYRQLMYAVIWKAIAKALTGKKQGWGKVLRKATVQIVK